MGNYERRGHGRGHYRPGNGGRRRDHQSQQSDNGDKGSDGNKSGYYSGRDRGKYKCFNCNKYGHFAAECRRPKREKESTNEAANLSKAFEDEPALLLSDCQEKRQELVLLNESVVPVLSRDNQTKENSHMWYLDNGATNHMTGDREKFKELDERRVTGKVKFGDGSSVDIKGKGMIMFKCKNGEDRLLREVYYIPTLCSNIISLGQLSEEGNKVILNGGHLWVYDEKGRLVDEGTEGQLIVYTRLFLKRASQSVC